MAAKKKIKKTPPIFNDRIKSLILHAISFCEDSKITISKIYKILYFIDFGHYAKYNKSITKLEYLRFSYGPVPGDVSLYLALLEDEGVIDVVPTDEEFNGEIKKRKVYKVTSPVIFRDNLFSSTEKKVIDSTLNYFKDATAKTASCLSHNHYSWLTTKKHNVIPYDKSKHCDFVWIDYFSHDKDKEDYMETENLRKKFHSNKELSSLVKEIQDL